MKDYRYCKNFNVALVTIAVVDRLKLTILLFLFFVSSQVYSQILFEETTNTAGPFHTGESWGASWGDMNSDLYPDLFVSNHGMATSIYRNNGDGSFTDVISQVDLSQKLIDPVNKDTTFADIHGGAWADFDNDGDQDLFVARSSKGSQLYLFENDGSGKFTESHRNYGIPTPAMTSGRMPLLFDYTGDGFLDFAYAKNGSALELFKRKGTDFVYAKNQTGIANQCERNHYGFASRLFDSNNLIYVCMEARGVAQRAYDTSTLPFTDVTASIDHTGTWSDAVLADVNNDARLDMIITTGRTRPNGVKKVSDDRIEAWLSVTGSEEKSFTFKSTGAISVNLYARKIGSVNRNNADRFDKIFIGSSGDFPPSLPIAMDPLDVANQGVLANRDSLGSYMGYDPATGLWTVHLTAAGDSDLVYFAISGKGLTEPAVIGLTTVDGPRTPEILINNGSRLEDVPGAKGLQSVLCGSVVAEDFDNDMDVDLYMVCRTSLENLVNRFYWNNGDGSFTEGKLHGAEGVTGVGIDSGAGTGEIAVSADYNVDGFMDLFVTNGNRIFPHFVKDGFTAGGPDQLFRNTAANANHWLEFDLQGINSNRNGFATKVTVTAAGVTQLREQNGQYHRSSHDHQRLHFGLGNNTTATVSINWPDGSIDVHQDVEVDKVYLAKQDGSLEAVFTPEPKVVVNIDDLTVSETGNAMMTVRLSRAAAVNVVVDYASADGSAIAGEDYSQKSGRIVFTPGQKVKTRTVTIIDDDLIEGDEQFFMRLSNPVNSVIAQSSATVTITDDDFNPAIVLESEQISVNEGSSVDLRFRLSKAAAKNVVVSYSLLEGSAQAGSDYIDKSGVIVFKPGETVKTREIKSLQDALSEDDEQFTFVLSNPVNATLNQANTVVTIVDDDAVLVNINNVTVSEGQNATMTVTLSAAFVKNVVVDYETINGTATAGSDYLARTGKLVFKPGQTVKTRTVQTLEDSTPEAVERFRMRLSNVINAVLGSSSGVITVED